MRLSFEKDAVKRSNLSPTFSSIIAAFAISLALPAAAQIKSVPVSSIYGSVRPAWAQSLHALVAQPIGALAGLGQLLPILKSDPANPAIRNSLSPVVMNLEARGLTPETVSAADLKSAVAQARVLVAEQAKTLIKQAASAEPGQDALPEVTAKLNMLQGALSVYLPAEIRKAVKPAFEQAHSKLDSSQRAHIDTLMQSIAKGLEAKTVVEALAAQDGIPEGAIKSASFARRHAKLAKATPRPAVDTGLIPRWTSLGEPKTTLARGINRIDLSQRHAERPILPEDEFRQLAEQAWGRILAGSELPLLRQALAAPMARLRTALAKVSEERIGVSLRLPAELWIHDSPRANAYMSVVETPAGVKKAVWTMTTGMVKAFFDSFPGDPERAMRALLGVMAHEISHTLDVFDPRGIENTYRYREPEPILTSGIKIENPNQALQAIELRTDVEAVNLLREAQLPDDALIDGLTALQKILDPNPEERAINPLYSYFSSHPDDQMRLSAQRIALTALRYMRGDKPVINDPIPAGLAAEGKLLLPAAPQAPPQALPATILETIAGIEKILAAAPENIYSWTSDAWGASQTTDSNGRTARSGYLKDITDLIIHLDQLLIDRGTTLTASEKEAVIALNLRLIDPATDAGISHREKHRSLMARIPLYRSEEYKTRLRHAAARFLRFKKIEQKTGDDNAFMPVFKQPSMGGIKALQLELRRFSNAAPRDVFIEATQAALASALVTWMNYEPDESSFRGLADFSENYFGYGDRFAPFFHERVLPRVVARSRANWRIAYREVQGDEAFSRLNFRYQVGAASPQTIRATLDKHQRAFLDRLSPDLRNRYRAVAREIWRDRARFAVLDLVTSRHTYWPIVYELLAIPPKQADAELNDSVKKFAMSAGYAPFLKSLVSTELVQKWMPTYAEPEWAGDDLFPYLTGHQNPDMVSKDLESQVARILVAGGYLDKKQRILRRMYGERLSKALSARGYESLSLEELARMNAEVLEALQGRDGSDPEAAQTALDILARCINESTLQPAHKRDLLRRLFIETPETGRDHFPMYASWYNGNSRGSLLPNVKRVISELLRAGVVNSYADFLSRAIFSPGRIKHPLIFTDDNLKVIVALKGELLQELQDVVGATDALDRFETLLDATLGQAAHIDYSIERNEHAKDRISAQLNSPEWYELKNAFARALFDLPEDAERKLKAFATITATGGTPETDEVFDRILREPLRKSADARKKLVSILKSKTITSGTLRVALAREALESDLQILEGREVGKGEYQQFLDVLHDLVPQDSSSRDQLIEDSLWRLRIENPEIVEMAQDAKSSNWRKANPKAIQWLSTHQWLTQDLTPEQRLALADFVADPRNKPFPPEIEAAFDKRFAETEEKIGIFGRETDIARARERYRLAGKLQIQAFAREATPNEKIPSIEMLFPGGSRPPMEQPGFQQRLMRQYLGYAPGSLREQVLIAYLNSLPAKERSVTMAFMLSRKGEAGAGLKPIFEVFQTVGIKAGQLGALWKLFGSEASQELKELKDKANPIEKAEILSIMRAALTPEEISKIDHLEAILGSASVKAVVLVRLKNGQEAVMMVRRPYAEEQIRSNLGRARAFLGELEKLGVAFDYRAMRSMLDTVEEQLADELRFSQEAEKVAQAKVVFEQLNKEMRKELRGWRFIVPQLLPGFEIRDHLLFMEKAGGTTLNQSPASKARQIAARLVLVASFRGLFRHGWFNADGHAGNWLMDKKTRTIYPIDFGQAENFSQSANWFKGDELYHVAQFLRASLSRSKRGITLHGLALSESQRPTREQLRKLDEAIDEVMARDIKFEDRTLALVSAFSESDIKIKRKVSFGALKGLVTLEQEEYVPDLEFTRQVRREIARILAGKAPALIEDAILAILGPARATGR